MNGSLFGELVDGCINCLTDVMDDEDEQTHCIDE